MRNGSSQSVDKRIIFQHTRSYHFGCTFEGKVTCCTSHQHNLLTLGLNQTA